MTESIIFILILVFFIIFMVFATYAVNSIKGEYSSSSHDYSSGESEIAVIEIQGAIMESLLGFKRAGADGILTYAAVRAAKALNG